MDMPSIFFFMEWPLILEGIPVGCHGQVHPQVLEKGLDVTQGF